MAKQKKEIDLVERPMEAVEETFSKAESLFHKYQKQATYLAGAIIAVVALTWAYREFIVAPAEEEAQLALYPAQDVFSQDSLRLALNGNAEFMGFIEIADEYGSTKAGNLANYYAGLSYLSLVSPQRPLTTSRNLTATEPSWISCHRRHGRCICRPQPARGG